MARLNTVKKFRGTSKTESGNLTCQNCRAEIKKGDSYQWWANRAPGQRSSFRNIRCINCTPTIAERTPGRAGQLMMIQQNAEEQIAALTEFDDTGDLEALASDIACEVREMADELRESADNIESGFGHPTQQSEELAERADNIEGQADEIESCDFEDAPDEEEIEEKVDDILGYDPDVDPDPPTGADIREARTEVLEDWREDQRQRLNDAVSEIDIY